MSRHQVKSTRSPWEIHAHRIQRDFSKPLWVRASFLSEGDLEVLERLPVIQNLRNKNVKIKEEVPLMIESYYIGPKDQEKQ